MLPNPTAFLRLMAERGYPVSSFNVVGWRNIVNRPPNSFNDVIALYWKESGSWIYDGWPATTLPGEPWLKAPMHKKGTAILMPGQYKDAYSIGLFKGYPALNQTGPVRVYRDNNRDSQINLNPDTIEEGLFGICIHKAGFWTQLINRNSAGCQVFKSAFDFEYFMDLCRARENDFQNHFTYTLLEL